MIKYAFSIVYTRKDTTVEQQLEHNLFAIASQKIEDICPGNLLQSLDILIRILNHNARDIGHGLRFICPGAHKSLKAMSEQVLGPLVTIAVEQCCNDIFDNLTSQLLSLQFQSEYAYLKLGRRTPELRTRLCLRLCKCNQIPSSFLASCWRRLVKHPDQRSVQQSNEIWDVR